MEVILDTLWHSLHFVRWIKLFFLEKRCILCKLQLGMYVRPPWECCVLEEATGMNDNALSSNLQLYPSSVFYVLRPLR